MYGENRNSYKELDAVIHSLLEKHRSEFQVEIRNETKEVCKDIAAAKEGVENKMESLATNIVDMSEKQLKSARMLVKLAFAIIIINMLISLNSFGLF